MKTKNVLLIGAGPMAIEYAKILKDINVPFEVVGRGAESALKFEEIIGVKVVTGGIDSYMSRKADASFDHAIVVVNEKELGAITKLLLKNDIKNVLVEKPGGCDIKDINSVYILAKETKANVFLGYNRRFYASVNKAQQIIAEDGGVTSFNFEFTEWSHIVKNLVKAPGVKEMWFLHNSTHVIDFAFYMGGKPKEFCSYTSGGLSWHPTASVFCGAGITEKGALFSYNANWESPGRWSLETLTKKHRLIFRPMEKLQIQNIGAVSIDLLEIDDDLDKKFKPGLYKQTTSFLNGETEKLCSIREQVENIIIYKQIGCLP
jgi:predicted dehydrogenase